MTAKESILTDEYGSMRLAIEEMVRHVEDDAQTEQGGAYVQIEIPPSVCRKIRRGE